MQDDILDVYGNEQKFGKQVGGDIIANKKTFLLLSALKNASGQTAIELQKWLAYDGSDNASKVEAVKNIYETLHVKECAEKKMDELYAEAISHLDALPINQQRTAALRKLSSMLMLRES